jgi:hypothetical protein
LGKDPAASLSHSQDITRERSVVSPAASFAELFGRTPGGAQAAVLAEATDLGLTPAEIGDAVRIAALRLGMIDDPVSELAYFAGTSERLMTRFDGIDALADRLLAAAPDERIQAWTRPAPSVNESTSAAYTAADLGLIAQARASEGEVLTVDQLMALDGSEFVRTAYRKLLLREADEGGIQTYLNALGAGRSKAAVIYSLHVSPEGQAAAANLIGLQSLLARQRRMRRWPVRKLLQAAGVPL